jgi:hypothetical protein
MQNTEVRSSVLGIVAFLLALFLGSLLLYLATLTQVHTFDALSYVLDVDRKPWHEVFHPHHLAYGPLGVLIRHLMHSAGWHGSIMLPLQLLNALAGAAGIALFAALVHDITHRLDLALCGALLLGSSYAYWYYAVEVEVYTIAALFLILCLWLLITLLNHPTPGLCIALGTVHGMAVLFHQTNVLLALPIGLALLQTPHSSRLFLRCLAAYAVPCTLIVAGSYLLVGIGVTGAASLAEFVKWSTSYAHTGWWGGALSSEKWSDLGKGLSDTLAQPGGALYGLLLLGLLVAYLRHLVQRHASLVSSLALWLITYGGFFLWWEPDNIEFWIACLPPAILLLLLALHSAGPRWHPGVWVALAVGITMAGVNYDAISERGNEQRDVHRQLAHQLANQSNPRDLLIVSDGLQELYLPYYESHGNTWSLNQALFEHNGIWPAACTSMQQRIDTAVHRGVAVFLSDAVVHPPHEQTPFSDPILKRFNLSQQEITRCFESYLPGARLVEIGPELPSYYRIPAAQERADGAGWDFAHGPQGWQGRRISSQQFDGGWEFLPGVDPQLISPVLSLDTAQYHAINIHMVATAGTTITEKLELYFIDDQGHVDIPNVVERTLERDFDGVSKIYGITLEGRAGWEGTVTGFRLDPIGNGDGGRIRIERIQLIRKDEIAH